MKTSILMVLLLALSSIASGQSSRKSSPGSHTAEIRLQNVQPEDPGLSIGPAAESGLRSEELKRMEFIDEQPSCSSVGGHHPGARNCPCNTPKPATPPAAGAAERAVRQTITTAMPAPPCSRLAAVCGK